MKSPSRPHLLLACTAAAAALLLGACNRQSDQTVGEKIDSAVATAERKVDDAQVAASRATDQAAQKIESAADKVGDAVSDAAVTASINAELAKDSKLSALRINVDTSGGRVTLSGKAPDGESRERATRLASAVKGVTSVDNRLEIGG